MEIEEILTSNVVDLSSIKSFFASDKEMLIQLIGVYISDTTPRVNTLKESLSVVNYEEVRNISHFLKSSLGLMGVKCLDEITALEQKAINMESEEIIKSDLTKIIPICEESIAEYQQIMNKLELL